MKIIQILLFVFMLLEYTNYINNKGSFIKKTNIENISEMVEYYIREYE